MHVATALIGIFALGWLTVQAASLSLTHDEHQFLAAADLVADHGLLPYRDFPFHHTPLLPLLYALVLRLGDQTLWLGRLASSLFGALATMLVFRLAAGERRPSLVVGLLAAALFLFNPLTAYTSGRAWNHDLALAFALGATALLRPHDSKGLGSPRAMAGGLLLGLAVSTRLSFAPLLIPAATMILVSEPKQDRIKTTLAWGMGVGAGLLPTILLSALDPRRALFGNWVYPRLSKTYYGLIGYRRAMDLPGKLADFGEMLLEEPSVGLLMAGATLAAAGIIWGMRKETPSTIARRLWMPGMTVAALVGTFAPTPTWRQYAYAVIPFMALSCADALRLNKLRSNRWKSVIVAACLASLAIGLILSLTLRSAPALLGGKQDPIPSQIHALGLEIRERVPPGQVLTVAPILPLEAGLEIYPQFSTGPFTWRVADLLTAARRDEYRIISMHELEAYLANQPPAAILVGLESGAEGLTYADVGGLEAPLIDYAIRHGYRLVRLRSQIAPSDLELWVSPLP